jgi:hypothetical protein
MPVRSTISLEVSLARLASWMPFGHAARDLGWLTRSR